MADDLETLTQRVADLETKKAEPESWMGDVQRAIAILLVGTFAAIVVAVSLRLVFSGATDTLEDMAKTLQAALVNMGLIALGFFFGSSLSKRNADTSQQKLVERLMPPPPPNGGGPEVVAAAAAAAATVAAKVAAPQAAAEAAPPAAAEAAPPAAEAAVSAELDERGYPKQKE